ncbi:ABC transporter substrate-binding protein [Williamsia sp. Leaf354]|jgi:phospholipid/cholesterol/gamma-HCH transport system substrate-binding protein|uniref:MCE family protein n=1 Tax=Williamsia sp. Leaf354 TaxID=1736349 RepID=UPI0006F783E1|nr:MCE family protein [Williamsia sp. Leaf354]KQR96195.1 ABC transporter substrate-binding protein [Williamsia sp. Leaf354]
MADKKENRRPDAPLRSPVTVGALGLAILIMAALSSFYLANLPLVGAGTVYKADFTEAAGLKPRDEVRVAGVKVGTVQSVDIVDNKVQVAFGVGDTWVGDQTSASIQIKTVLGQKYLAIEPRGDKLADPGKTITQTTSPYDVIEAFNDASENIQEIDTDQLATSFRTLSAAFSGTPAELGGSLDGLTRLSTTIASRDQEVRKLLDATKGTSKILADRNQEFTRLIAGAGDLLQELNTRQSAISRLLSSTSQLSTTLTGIVRDNEKQIGPALESLKGVTDLLQKQDQNLRDSITNLAPFYRLYANVLGNGRWFDSVITNILPPGLPAQNTTRPPNKNQQLNNGGTGATG